MQPNPMDLDINPDVPDLTDELQPDKKHFITKGAFGVVYLCPRTTGGEVAVKAITFSHEITDLEREKLKRSLRREFGIWRRLNHPNIVLFLGKTCGADFGFDYDCIVSTWMPQGTLHMYIKNQGGLPRSRCVQLIRDIARGLNYLHQSHDTPSGRINGIVHGDLHPGNVLIDDEGNARLSDFGLSQVLLPVDDGLSYLRTMSAHSGAVMWAAPELVHPKLYPEWNKDGKPRATLNNDIYALGNVILFVLSEKTPWSDVPTAWSQLKKRQIPQRREFSAIPDDVWKFLKKCWSPKQPGARPSAQGVLSYISNTLENMLTLSRRDSSNNSLSRFGSSLQSLLSHFFARPTSRSIPDTHPYPVFRLLMIGNTGVGKSALANRVCGVESVYTSGTTSGTARIDQEHISLANDRLVIHDSLGFEAGDERNMDVVKEFVTRRKAMVQLKDQVHAIWLCLQIPYPGRRLIEEGVESFLQRRNEIIGRIPLVVVLTKLDVLDRQLEHDLPRNETLEQYKLRYMNDYCIGPLRRAAGNDVTYAIVSVEDGYEHTLSNLVEATEKLASNFSGNIPWSFSV